MAIVSQYKTIVFTAPLRVGKSTEEHRERERDRSKDLKAKVLILLGILSWPNSHFA